MCSPRCNDGVMVTVALCPGKHADDAARPGRNPIFTPDDGYNWRIAKTMP